MKKNLMKSAAMGALQTVGRFSQRTEAGPDCLHR